MPFAQPLVSNPYPYAYAQTLPLANTEYSLTQSLVAGVYTISWSGGGTINIDFFNGSTFVGTATGTSSITFNLAQSVTNYKMWNTVGNVSVVISLTGLALAPVSGVLTTYTATGTVTQTGWAYVVLVGGGGGSQSHSGGTGGIQFGRLFLSGSDVVTIGNPGTPGQFAPSNIQATAGTSTTLQALTATGGQPGNTSNPLGGTPNGATGTNSAQTGFATSTVAAITSWSFFTQGSTGSGGDSGAFTGAGAGIGTGGNGGTTAPTAATGFGSSGGATVTSGITSGLSKGGVCYIIQ